jgi:hypothetical protein
MDTEKILIKREQTHGGYTDTAAYAQSIKNVLRLTEKYHSLAPTAKESLDLIATKIARILSGDAELAEHWEDIAGYAGLEARRLGKMRDKLQPSLMGGGTLPFTLPKSVPPRETPDEIATEETAPAR